MSDTQKGAGDEARDGAPPASVVSIAPDLAALAQNGAAVSIASCNFEGLPIVGLGLGCRILQDGTLRVLLSQAANERLISAVVNGGAAAVTFTATRDHTSFQVKASSALYLGPSMNDAPEIDRQISLLREGLVEIGFSPEQAEGYTAFNPVDLVAIALCPERVFSQTPGPGAGSELTP